jgi:isopentenyl-diphosphate Delta-isomerase
MRIRVPAWVDGELTPVEKMEVHRRGLRHRAVSVFVLRGDATLLQKRAAGKYHTPGLWANACCTHPAWGEDPADTAIRRLREELGLTGLPLAWRERIEYRADVGGGLVEHEVVDLFAAEAPPGLVPRPAPEEVAETCWIRLHDLVQEIDLRPDSYTPWLRIYLRDHGHAIFGTVPAT